MSRPLRLAAAVPTGLLLATVLTACGGGPPAAEVNDSPSESASSSQTKAPLAKPRKPKTGECYQLSRRQATQSTSARRPIDCADEHTAVTIAVPRLETVVDGHSLAVDSDEVQQRTSSACPSKLPGWIGGDLATQRLSVFQVVWFTPTLREVEAGANWFRCDLVAPSGAKSLARFTGNAESILDDPAALDTFGRCATGDPQRRSTRQVACAEEHSWRAIRTVDVPAEATYQGKEATDAATAECRGLAEVQASDPLDFQFSFQWPARNVWDDGGRFGYCWVPTA